MATVELLYCLLPTVQHSHADIQHNGTPTPVCDFAYR